jgi:hypothetical protein
MIKISDLTSLYKKAATLGAYAVYSDTPTLLFGFAKKQQIL